MIGQGNQEKKISSPKSSGDSQTPRTVIITSIITAITTIVVSFIAIIPEYRRSDKETIEKLNKKVDAFEKSTQIPSGSLELKGQVLGKNGKPLDKAEIYLIPATGSENMAITDDAGNFIFDHLDSGSHWIVVRDQTSMSTRGLIGHEQAPGEVQLPGVTVKYNLIKE